jgi:ribosome-binding factor A
MSGRRLLKAAEAIREVVSMAILTELRDPRVKHVTVVGVEVTPDMREAKVLISIMGNESQQRTTLNGLDNARGFLQTRIAERIDTRYTPRLSFVVDDDQIARERNESEASKTAESVADGDESSPSDSESPNLDSPNASSAIDPAYDETNPSSDRSDQ